MTTDYTTTELIASVKRRATVPTNQNLFEDRDFVKVLSDELLATVVPRILSVREDYFVAYKDTTVVAGTQVYTIPTRAIGGKLKDVVIVDPTNGNAIQNLPRLTYQDISLYQPGNGCGLYGFYLEGNNVHLYPTDAFATKTLRVYYYRRPSRLVQTSSCGKVTNIVGTLVTLDLVPSSWTASTELDAIAGRPGFEPLQDDFNASSIAGFDLSFATLPTGLQVGDYIAEAGESPIAQIPYDAFSWLSQLGAVKCVEAIGNSTELQNHQAMAQKLEAQLMNLIAPRVDEESKKIVSRRGIFRASRGVLWPK